MRERNTSNNSASASRRLPKAERRQQLLDVARSIVRNEGTDALTLVSLAERADVTRPVAYEHFKTRPGLLIALARHIDDRQVELFREAFARTQPRLAEVARVASSAYMRCVTQVGREWHAITAALQGDPEMDAVQHELLERYAEMYCDVLAPCTKLPRRELKRRCVAIIGAAEALAREMLLEKLDEAVAAATLRSLIVSWLE
ncbi:MAG TPA: TetR/AcrR family transcriptional regulator [Polyangiaceae bacterium]|nr:TetR/AcrR family transcriptional regulator [Polyangiaceae bacterium]